MSGIILTALGIGKLVETTYLLGDRRHTSKFCNLALSRTLPTPANNVLVLLTNEASIKYRNDLEEEAARLGVTCEILDITEGKTIDEVWSVFDQVIQRLSAAVTPRGIYLDITNSFRHLPLLFFASLSYLEATRKAELRGIYYGAYEARDPVANLTPIFDLSPLTALVKGSFAVKSFMETGGVNTLGEFLQSMPGFDERVSRNLDRELKTYHPMQASGLTLEAGNQARALLDLFPGLYTEQKTLVAGRELAEKLRESLERIALEKVGKKEWKPSLKLDLEELHRQLNFIGDKLDQEETAQALMLLREWVVNRFWLTRNPDGNRLASKDRHNEIEARLYRASRVHDKTTFPAGDLYNLLGDPRNEFAHAGFRKNVVKVEKRLKKTRETFAICSERLRDDAFWTIPDLPKTCGKLLVSGLGSSVGLLYTALRLTNPDRAIVLTSKEVQVRIPEVSSRAGNLTTDKIDTFLLQEVFTGFDETPDLIAAMEPHLLQAAEIIINLTGGTTCMQWVMQAVYERARELGLPVRRVAFVDRRPTVEQQAKPYELGQLIEIDSTPEKSS